VWYKSANPRKWDHRLKNAWEPIYYFSKTHRPYINHDNILMRTESAFVNKRGIASYNELTGNLGGYHDIADQGSGMTIADNILYFPSALLTKDKYQHPAKFPIELAEFFVRGFCPPDGTVCDPFMGSGSTALAALRYDRKCIGIELEANYIEMARERMKSPNVSLKKNAEQVQKYF
jgi:DNA modification methylase